MGVVRKGVRRRFLMVLLGLLALVGPLCFVGGGQRTSAQTVSCWRAEITEQWPHLELAGSVLRVFVEGQINLPVVIRSEGSYQVWGVTGTKPEYGPYAAEFAALSKGRYFVEPLGLGTVFEIYLDGKNYTHVWFRPQPCAAPPVPTPRPATATPRPTPKAAATQQYKALPTSLPALLPAPIQPGWQGHVIRHEKNPDGIHWATVAVRVIGRPAGQAVEIRAGDWARVAKTGTKPEHGPDALEFGALQPGTYQLTPQDLGANLSIMVERGDFVLIEFRPVASGRQTTQWVGQIVDNTNDTTPTEHSNSAITVIVAGKPWHEVEIRTDGWQSTTKTGFKPEYGPDAAEFGGLRAGVYTIEPKGLGASVQVKADGWGWAMVRFDEASVPVVPPAAPTAQPISLPPGAVDPSPSPAPTTIPPTPTPAGPQWRGWVVSNSSGQHEGTGIWSVVIVRVLNWPGVTVHISGGGGWVATCLTGTKPEYGPDACEFGGLWPGTYYLRPEGADIQVPVTMDGLGTAIVEFASQ